jgi:hypothetical protein
MKDSVADDAKEEIHPGHPHQGRAAVDKVFDDFQKNPP